jgi:2-isopropylmalate synthase
MSLSQSFTEHYLDLEPEPHIETATPVRQPQPSADDSTLMKQGEEFEVDIDANTAKKVATEIKQLEGAGYQFDGAEASVAVLMRRASPNYRPAFHLENLRVVVDSQGAPHEAAEATVEIRVQDNVVTSKAYGNGPVAALDNAMREALRPYFPQLERSRMADYRVRTLDAEHGTSAIGRVMIDFKDGTKRWTTVGASPNIIEASCKALKDAFEYAILESSRARHVLSAAG